MNELSYAEAAVCFTQVCQFLACSGFEKFYEMYKSMGFQSESYAVEKYNSAQRNFGIWWCNLDIKNQVFVIKYVKEFDES